MSIDTMNESNQIGRETLLFGFIAEEAQQNRFSVTLNRLFKAAGNDAMMIPMNIREDDFYYTLSNMRESQLGGAFIGAEYQKSAAEIIDTATPLTASCGLCDVVVVKDKKLIGDFIAVQSLFTLLAEKKAIKIAVIGSGSLAKAIALSNKGCELYYYHEYVESLMQMNVDVDINRLSSGCDLSGHDAVIDASSVESLAMVAKLPPLCIDLKNMKQFSALRQRAMELGAEYMGYEAQLSYLTQQAYDYILLNRKDQ